ncbi:hypothetical protein QBC39DRAFT_409900 [Podospora conica]|nr:hypothetical protein QBC39DRAFT_409900 [Schizothecium conicum]
MPPSTPTTPSTSPFNPLPLSRLSLPSTPLLHAALSFLTTHTTPPTKNHSLRSAFFALLLLPPLLLAILLHDLGWSTTPALLTPSSTKRRFEVSGADIARDFLLSHSPGEDSARVQLVWDAIALHTTPSIAAHKEVEVAVAAMGIAADFEGAWFSADPTGEPKLGGLISVEEHREVVRAFPREGFREELVGIMCGLCRDRPETVVDNFVGEFGVVFGLDGEGGGREEWRARMEAGGVVGRLMGGLERAREVEEGDVGE